MGTIANGVISGTGEATYCLRYIIRRLTMERYKAPLWPVLKFKGKYDRAGISILWRCRRWLPMGVRFWLNRKRFGIGQQEINNRIKKWRDRHADI